MRIFLLLISSPSLKSFVHRYSPEFLMLLFPQNFPSIHQRFVAPAEASSNKSKRLNPLAGFHRNHVIFREYAWLSLLLQFRPSPPPRQRVPSLPSSPSWATEHPASNSSSAAQHHASS